MTDYKPIAELNNAQFYEGPLRKIELGQKQYEYYRDLLLSFLKPEADKAVVNA